jgi:signal transduction histidine kinase
MVELEHPGGQVYVLAIDDSPTYLYYISHELRPTNYLLETANDPEEGLEKVRSGHFDCVLVDCEMPKLDGFAVCRRIREMRGEGNPHVVLILVSSHEDKGHIKLGFEAGADDYIFKSADGAILRARIDAFLRRRFLLGQNRKIVEELREREVRAMRAQVAQKEAEARAALADQLAAANRALALTNLRLDSANRELEEFTYSVAHDLKEPLRMVTIYIQLLQKEYGAGLDEKAGQFMAWSIEGAQRMDRFIQDLLEYTRATGSRNDAPRAQTSLNEIVEFALENLTMAVQESGCEIAVAQLPALWVESARLQQVFQNLLGNAIKYRRPDARLSIRVWAERSGDTWTINVQDNGVGIDSRDLESVFQLFRRGRNEEPNGTGVGLSICRRIVEQHGGKIWVESQLSQGSTFRFTLPEGPAAE